MRQYLTYQHNVQKFFREHANKYNGVVIPLSIAASFPGGTYGFIRALCSRHRDVQYAIDPRNALFQKQWDRDNVRPPHKKMADILGKPYKAKSLSRNLEPEDFANEDTLRGSVKNCLDFQKRFRGREEEDRKLNKYKKLLGVSSLTPLKSPQHLVPPYYQFSNLSDHWYEVSMNSIKVSNDYRDGIPIRPVLHFRAWGEISDWASCFSDLSTVGTKEFWYYPNNFKEHEAEEEELAAYRDAIKAAKSNGLHPFVLFGGYFAILMSYFGLNGFGNGIGYGEWRDSGYHRGGTAMTRLYLLKLHRYVDPTVAQHLIEHDADYFGSDSEIVAGYIKEKKSVVNISSAEALDHFMECRRKELEFVATRPRSDAVAELGKTISRLKKIGPLEQDKYGKSLERWQEAIH